MQQHAWVVTVSPPPGEGRRAPQAVFWESVTGYRYAHTPVSLDWNARPEPPTYPYRTITCIFNHQSFYANCQVLLGSSLLYSVTNAVNAEHLYEYFTSLYCILITVD